MKNFIKTKILFPIFDVIFAISDIINKFKKKKPTVYECTNCHKIHENPKKCECGGTRYIVNPKKYRMEGDRVLCKCKNSELEPECHYDCDDGFIEEYGCSKCFNHISIFQYFDFEEYERNRLKDAASDRYDLKEDDLYRNMPWNRDRI